MKIFRQFCVILLCLLSFTVAGCTRSGDTQQKNAAEDGQDRYVVGIIKEVRDEEYLISMNFSRSCLVADKCGTDYEKGDSVKVWYAGEVRNEDNDMGKWKEEDGRVAVNEDYKMYIMADEYTEISLWDNDYTFYGVVEKSMGVYDGDEIWDKEPYDTCYYFTPMRTEEEGQANRLLGDDAGFVGYESRINDGEGMPRIVLMYNTRVKITYDPETMLVTRVEPAEDKQSANVR